ncbi:MAG: MoaD/ThiS family protein [Chloroflexota bacterium]
MGRVRVELMMWLGKELGPDWISPQDVRARMETDVAEGTTVRQLLDLLAQRYPAIQEKVFRDHDLAPYTIATLNQVGMDKAVLLDRPLCDGDALTILPIVVGG